jgi:hypothetical protein
MLRRQKATLSQPAEKGQAHQMGLLPESAYRALGHHLLELLCGGNLTLVAKQASDEP